MAVMALQDFDWSVFEDEDPVEVTEAEFFEAEREQDVRAANDPEVLDFLAEQASEDRDWLHDMMQATAEWNHR